MPMTEDVASVKAQQQVAVYDAFMNYVVDSAMTAEEIDGYLGARTNEELIMLLTELSLKCGIASVSNLAAAPGYAMLAGQVTRRLWHRLGINLDMLSA